MANGKFGKLDLIETVGNFIWDKAQGHQIGELQKKVEGLTKQSTSLEQKRSDCIQAAANAKRAEAIVLIKEEMKRLEDAIEENKKKEKAEKKKLKKKKERRVEMITILATSPILFLFQVAFLFRGWLPLWSLWLWPWIGVVCAVRMIVNVMSDIRDEHGEEEENA